MSKLIPLYKYTLNIGMHAFSGAFLLLSKYVYFYNPRGFFATLTVSDKWWLFSKSPHFGSISWIENDQNCPKLLWYNNNTAIIFILLLHLLIFWWTYWKCKLFHLQRLLQMQFWLHVYECRHGTMGITLSLI